MKEEKQVCQAIEYFKGMQISIEMQAKVASYNFIDIYTSNY